MRVTAFYQDVTRVKADIFIAGFPADVRPPRGLVGKVDWYLGGFLSRQIRDRTFKGREGALTLVVAKGKLLTPGLLLVGLGEAASLERERTAAHFRRLGQTVREMRLKSVALEIPPMETPRTGSYPIFQETLAGFREAFLQNGNPLHCEIQILARNEEESEGWRRIIRGALR